MARTKRNWFWNILIIITLIACLLAFVVHYKNWSKIEESQFKITSGIYRQTIPLSEFDSISFVQKLPEMERRHGFSWLAKEKGIFNDSLTNTKVYVFVDDLRQPKIRLVHHDSLKLFLNYSDSLKTQEMHEFLEGIIIAEKENPN
ncbi:hypothetical protein [Allomuricauda sp. d1]|uniref:hypothetical protein n=1 Tax=Allomuricauda sp. d1 TaxID=3136725 RepID=UPI0031D348CD